MYSNHILGSQYRCLRLEREREIWIIKDEKYEKQHLVLRVSLDR